MQDGISLLVLNATGFKGLNEGRENGTLVGTTLGVGDGTVEFWAKTKWNKFKNINGNLALQIKKCFIQVIIL